MHEFLHAIGLGHASMPHEAILVMATPEAPNNFYSLDESEEHEKNKYYISEQEKQVIRMLYSSGIPSGLKKSVFIKKINAEKKRHD
jgi:hypothetical protein